MPEQILNRYTLDTLQPAIASLYPRAEVWLATDSSDGRPVTVISYPLVASGTWTRTTRALWSAELRKLFRLSCLPFDPSLVGFEAGGYDDANKRLVLVMRDAQLPSAEEWLAGEFGRLCLAQWRGTSVINRAELWDHIAALFRGLSSIHESRIVHRSIQPRNLLIDESLSRDQEGFIKLGRFEASAFFYSARYGRSAPEDAAVDRDMWYTREFGKFSNRQFQSFGTPAGDVYSLLATTLWLASGRPTQADIGAAHLAAKTKDLASAMTVRQDVLAEAVQSLRTAGEQEFFAPLTRIGVHRIVTASQYFRHAGDLAEHLRQEGRADTGSLHLAVTLRAAECMQRLWSNPNEAWRTWLPKACRQGRLIAGQEDSENGQHRASIILPNGWLLLCAVFRKPSGDLDWSRLSLNSVAEYARPQYAESVLLDGQPFRILDGRQLPPSSAHSWRPLFDAAAGQQDEATPAQQALTQLNLAELAFWEENVVPVRVTSVIKKQIGPVQEETVQIEQLLDDPEFPVNLPIRQQLPHDFATMLQDKGKPIEVELSGTCDLWDRERQTTRWVEEKYEVFEIPDPLTGNTRSLSLVRSLGKDDAPTEIGTRAYFKTKDQGWQMGLFSRRWQAVELLARHAILGDVLRNPRARQRRVQPLPLRLSYPQWSEEKDRLVADTLATAPLFLVQGPPGTGKSTYVSGLMKHILSEEEDPEARVLVVAQMHSAIDGLAERVATIFDQAKAQPWERPILLRLRTPRNAAGEEKNDLEMADKVGEHFRDCLNVLEKRIALPQYASIHQALRLEVESPRPSEEMQHRLIQSASIIFTTCTDSHLDAISHTEFDWVIIEEAGRLVGCDLVIPMRLGHRWILIGDPNQLGPYRKEDFAAVVQRQINTMTTDGDITQRQKERLQIDCQRLLGPFETLFEDLDVTQRQALTQQHRMHPQICNVVSNVFYGSNGLTSDPETAGRLEFLFGPGNGVHSERAVLWLDIPHLQWPGGIPTVEEKEKGGYSIANLTEAEIFRRWLAHLGTMSPTEPPPQPLSLVSITPYKLQRRLFARYLKAWAAPSWARIEDPGAFTATAYQGREADIVFLSMVRNNLRLDAGFLDRKQMNVALSRARRLLVIVGCFAMLEHRAASGHAEDEFVDRLVRELRPFVIPAAQVFPEVAQ